MAIFNRSTETPLAGIMGRSFSQVSSVSVLGIVGRFRRMSSRWADPGKLNVYILVPMYNWYTPHITVQFVMIFNHTTVGTYIHHTCIYIYYIYIHTYIHTRIHYIALHYITLHHIHISLAWLLRIDRTYRFWSDGCRVFHIVIRPFHWFRALFQASLQLLL